MSLVIRTKVKDRGEILWPPIAEPEGFDEKPRLERAEWVRDRVKEAAEEARIVLSTTPTRTVYASVTFKEDVVIV